MRSGVVMVKKTVRNSPFRHRFSIVIINVPQDRVREEDMIEGIFHRERDSGLNSASWKIHPMDALWQSFRPSNTSWLFNIGTLMPCPNMLATV
jgi:hypothetical protein